MKIAVNIATIVLEDVNKHMKVFREGVLDLAIAFGEGTKTISKGLYDILSATFAPAEAMDILTVSMRAARAGLTDTATAANSITTILLSYGMEAKESARVSDVLFETVRRGVVTFEELAPRIGRVASTAAVAGVAFEDLMANFATLTRAGLEVGFAVTAINQTLKMFLAPSVQSKIVAEELGISLDSTTLKTLGLVGAMEQFIGVMPEQVAEVFRNIRALRGVNAAIKQAAGLEEDYILLLNSAGRSQQAFAKNASTLKVQLDRLAEVGEVLKIDFLEPLLPLLNSITNATIEVASSFRKLNPELRSVGVMFVTVIAALGALATAVGLPIVILDAMGIAVGKVAAILVAAAVAVTAIIMVFNKVKRDVKELTADGLQLVDVLHALHYSFNAFTPIVIAAELGWKALTTSINFAIDALKKIPGVTYVFEGLAKVVGKVKDAIVGLTTKDYDATEASKDLADSVLKLTQELDKTAPVTDKVQLRFKGIIDALMSGGKATKETVPLFENLIESIKNTGSYSAPAKDELIRLFTAIKDGREAASFTRDEMKRLADEFEVFRQNMLKIKVAYEAVNSKALPTLRATAKVAVDSWQLIKITGRETSESLRNIWIDGVIPQIIKAYGEIPKEFAATHQEAVGESTALSNAYTVMFGKVGAEVRLAADKGVSAFQILSASGKISASNLQKAWETTVSNIIEAYGKIPEKFRPFIEKTTGLTENIVEAWAKLGEAPSNFSREAVKTQVAAFIELKDANQLTTDQARDMWKNLWGNIKKSFQEAEIPEIWKQLQAEVETTAEAEKDALKLVQKETVDGIHARYAELRKYYTLVRDLALREQALQVLILQEAEEIDKLTRDKMIEHYKSRLEEITQMEGISVERRKALLRDEINAMKKAGLKGTDIWADYMRALKDLGEDWRRSWLEIVEENLKQFENNVATAIANVFMKEEDLGEESLELFKARQEDQKRDLHNRLVEGEIDYRRYTLELANLDGQLAQKQKEHQSKWTAGFKAIVDEMKRFYLKALAEIIANEIAAQMRILAIKAATAIFRKALGKKEGEGGEEKEGFDIEGILANALPFIAMKLIGLQKGGIVTKPTIATIGEGGPEAVIPLTKAMRAPIEVHFHDSIDLRGAMPMMNDPAAIEKVYRDFWLPARRRYAGRLKDSLNTELL